MTSQQRRDAIASFNRDRTLRQPVAGVMNPEDIRLAAQEADALPLTNLEQVIRAGHPADREAIRRQAIERIKQYSDSTLLRKRLPLYEAILERVDAAILADAANHLRYLQFCIERDERRIVKAQTQFTAFLRPEPIKASIESYRRRIAEIALQRLTEAPQPLAEDAAGASVERGEAIASRPPLALCPA